MARGRWRGYYARSLKPLLVVCPQCGYSWKTKEYEYPVCPKCRRGIAVRRTETLESWTKLRDYGNYDKIGNIK
jgi:Zn-finger nucleic acid-binding protein